jgi:hypothetical protein
MGQMLGITLDTTSKTVVKYNKPQEISGLSLTEDLEILMLTYCDIITVVRYSFCSSEKYELINNSNWLWEQHTRAETQINVTSDYNVIDWKQEFIRVYSAQWCLAYNAPHCLGTCFFQRHSTIWRPEDAESQLMHGKYHFWEKFIGRKVIKQNSIAQFEFIVDKYYLCPENGYRLCLGVEPSTLWHENFSFANIVGANSGLSFIVASKQVTLCGTLKPYYMKDIKDGDVVQFTMDNGYTTENTVTLEMQVNGKKIFVQELPVAEYRPAASLCREQQITLKRVIVLQDKHVSQTK